MNVTCYNYIFAIMEGRFHYIVISPTENFFFVIRHTGYGKYCRSTICGIIDLICNLYSKIRTMSSMWSNMEGCAEPVLLGQV